MQDKKPFGDHDLIVEDTGINEKIREEFSSDKFLIHASVFLVLAILLYLLWVFIDPRVALRKEETINIAKVETTTTTTSAPPVTIKKTDTFPNGTKYKEELAKKTFESQCVQCHGWQEGILTADGKDPTMDGFFLKHYRRTATEWDITVDKMISFGSPTTINDKYLIVEYLNRNWGA